MRAAFDEVSVSGGNLTPVILGAYHRRVCVCAWAGEKRRRGMNGVAGNSMQAARCATHLVLQAQRGSVPRLLLECSVYDVACTSAKRGASGHQMQQLQRRSPYNNVNRGASAAVTRAFDVIPEVQHHRRCNERDAVANASVSPRRYARCMGLHRIGSFTTPTTYADGSCYVHGAST